MAPHLLPICHLSHSHRDVTREQGIPFRPPSLYRFQCMFFKLLLHSL